MNKESYTSENVLKVKYLNNYPVGKPKLKPSLEGDAGMDVMADSNYSFKAGEVIVVKTGLKFDIPFGYEIQVRPRSGLSIKNWLITNSPGTIDCGYKGELGIIIKNNMDLPREIYAGDRIAQIVFNKLTPFVLEEVDNVGDSERGESGFGSTGK